MGFVRNIVKGTKDILHVPVKATKEILHTVDKTANIGRSVLPMITAMNPATAEVTVPAMAVISGYDQLKAQLSGN